MTLAASPFTVEFPPWPVNGLVEDLRPMIEAECRRGRPMALATVRAAEGAAPRGLGAQMLVTGEGESWGYLAGGCIEADVIWHAGGVIADGQPRTLIYGAGGPIDLPLPCGGSIEVLVERLRPADTATRRLARSFQERRPVVWLSDGRTQRCAERAPCDPPPLRRWYDPPTRLVVVGADPTALALCDLAGRAGIAVVLARPKGPEAPPPLPGIAYLNGSMEEILAGGMVDPWTAVVSAAHDEDIDCAAALHALTAKAFLAGGIGSRRRGEILRARLRAAGAEEADAKAFLMPLGNPQSGRSPYQIALSALAAVMSAEYASRGSRRPVDA